MRHYALPLALFGLFLLLLQLNTAPIKITHQDNLTSLQSNQKILVKGLVVKEDKSRHTSTLTLDSGIVLQCENCPKYINKQINAMAILDRYNTKQKLQILKITIVS
jgi:hypothetical protein